MVREVRNGDLDLFFAARRSGRDVDLRESDYEVHRGFGYPLSGRWSVAWIRAATEGEMELRLEVAADPWPLTPSRDRAGERLMLGPVRNCP
jgi:hypothetical protein